MNVSSYMDRMQYILKEAAPDNIKRYQQQLQAWEQQYVNLQNTFTAQLSNTLQYDATMHSTCLSTLKQMEEIKKQLMNMIYAHDYLIRHYEEVKPDLSLAQASLSVQVKEYFRRYREVINDDFFILYQNYQHLTWQCEATKYYVNNQYRYVTPYLNLEEQKEMVQSFKIIHDALHVAKDIFYPTIFGIYYMNRKAINKKCASAFADYMLTVLNQTKKDYLPWVEKYFFTEGMNDFIKEVIEEFGKTQTYSKVITNYEIINPALYKKLNEQLNQLLFSTASNSLKVQAYCYVQELLTYYNEMITGLIYKSTDENYTLSEYQQAKFMALTKRKVNPTYATMLEILKKDLGKKMNAKLCFATLIEKHKVPEIIGVEEDTQMER